MHWLLAWAQLPMVAVSKQSVGAASTTASNAANTAPRRSVFMKGRGEADDYTRVRERGQPTKPWPAPHTALGRWPWLIRTRQQQHDGDKAPRRSVGSNPLAPLLQRHSVKGVRKKGGRLSKMRDLGRERSEQPAGRRVRGSPPVHEVQRSCVALLGRATRDLENRRLTIRLQKWRTGVTRRGGIFANERNGAPKKVCRQHSLLQLNRTGEGWG